MADDNVTAGLGEFLEAAGASLGGAQEALVEGTGVTARMGLSEAELEVKAAVQQTSEGVVLRTLSAGEIARGTVQPAAVSTIRVRYVAVAGPAAGPVGTDADAVAEVREDPAVKRLDKILGGLTFSAVYAPGAERWLVHAHDADGRLVRETLVADPPGRHG